MKVRKEVLKLRELHDSLCDSVTNINRIISSFESNLSKEERSNLSTTLKVVEKAISKMKEVVPNQ